MFNLSQFDFRHTFCKLPEDFWNINNQLDLQQKAELAYKMYAECLDDAYHFEELDDHNLILSRHFLWVVFRSSDGVDCAGSRLAANSLAYTGHLAVRN